MAEVPSQFISGVRPQVAPVAQPGPSAAGIMADGITRAGETILQGSEHHVAMQDHLARLKDEQQQFQQGTSASVDMAQFTADMQQTAATLRDQAPPGGDGHVEALKVAFDPAVKTLMDRYTNPTVRAHLLEQVAQFGTAMAHSEAAWQTERARQKAAGDGVQAINLNANTQYGTADPNQRDIIDRNALTAFAALPLNDNARAALVHKYYAESRPAIARGQADRGDFDGARATLTSDLAVQHVDPQAMGVARHYIETRQKQADASASQQLDAAYQQVNLDAQAAEQGQPSSDQARTIMQRYQALAVAGKTDAAAKVQVWRYNTIGADAAERHKADTVDQRQSAISALLVKPSLTPEEGATLGALQRQQAVVKSLPAIDAAQYTTNRSAPPVDLNDIASVRQRAAFVEQSRAANGGIGYLLSAQEVEPYATVVAHGSADDKVKLARQLVGLGQYGGQIADQITASHPDFAAALKLAPIDNHDGTLMRMALGGPDALKANSQLLTPQKVSGVARPTFDQLFNAHMSDALSQWNAVDRAEVKENARNVYLSAAGARALTHLDEGLAYRVMHQVVGARLSGGQWTGGMGYANGGNFLLPYSKTQAWWDGQIAAATHDPKAWQRAATNGVPVLNGQNLHSEDLARLVPVRSHDGTYYLFTDLPSKGGHALRTAANRLFTFDPAKLR